MYNVVEPDRKNYVELFEEIFEKGNKEKYISKIDNAKEYARVIEWTPPWSIGAPMPQIFSDGLKTYLIHNIKRTSRKKPK
jgi:hypothetical protein